MQILNYYVLCFGAKLCRVRGLHVNQPTLKAPSRTSSPKVCAGDRPRAL